MPRSTGLSRRHFLKRSAATAAAFGAAGTVWPRTARSAENTPGANERVRIGLIGTGGMGQSNLKKAMAEPNVVIVALNDVAEFRLAEGAKLTQQRQGQAARTIYDDYRPLLDDKSIDGVFICTPDHWHFRPFCDAIQAGKHVYQQKPMSHTIEQGIEMVRIAKAHPKQVVQIGTQRRSNEHYKDAKELIDNGKLGEIKFVRCWDTRNWMRRDPFAPRPFEGKLDWDRFQEPCKHKVKFDAWRYFAWRWFWDYAGGLVTDVGVHVLDIVHLLTGKTTPKSVVANGGVYGLKYWETPDVVNCVWDYGTHAVTFTGNFTNGNQGDGFAIYGTDATLYEKGGGRDLVVEAERGEPRIIAEIPQRRSETHEANWIRCIRTGQTPNAPIALGFGSQLPLLLANLAYRAGKKLGWDPDNHKVVGL
jgi:predicted dehydrogenase